MSTGFDPYHKLLGIPPEEQPPDHYRLLGLSRKFEDDIEVIENCSNRVMQSLRQHQSGAHGPEIAKLLNKVSNARRTLLNSEKKLAYDNQLRAASEAAAASNDVIENPEIEVLGTPDSAEPAVPLAYDDLMVRFKRRKKLLIPVASALILVGFVIFAVFKFGRSPVATEKVAEHPVNNSASDGSVSSDGTGEKQKEPTTVEDNPDFATQQIKDGFKIGQQRETELTDGKNAELRIRRPGIELPAPKPGKTDENLVELIDPVKDGSTGSWAKSETGLSTKSNAQSILVLPFESLPNGVSLEMSIERLDDANGEVFIQVPTSVKPALFGFDIGSPKRTGVYVDSNLLEEAPRTQSLPFFQTKKPTAVKLTSDGVALSIAPPSGFEPTFFGWSGDFRRLSAGPTGFPAVPKRIVVVTQGAKFKIHSLKIQKINDVELPDPSSKVNGADLIAVINQTRDVHRGDWGYTNRPIFAPASPYARLQVPVVVPNEYDLSISVEIPDNKAEVVVGLPVNGAVLRCYLSTRKCELKGLGQASLRRGTFPAGEPVQFDFQVRSDSLTVMKGGKSLYKEQLPSSLKTMTDDFSPPWLNSDEQQRIFLGTTVSSYKIHGLGMAANSGTELASSISPADGTLVGANTAPPDRNGFKRPEGTLDGPEVGMADQEIPKTREPTVGAKEAALNAVKSQFKVELQRAKKPAEKLALAERLKSTADGEAADSATRFVLLEQVCDLAAAAGEPKLALDTVDELSNAFECDAFGMKAEALKSLAKSTKEPDKFRILLEQAFTLANQAGDNEKYAQAADLCGAASGIAAKLKIRPIVEEATELKREMLERQDQFVKVEAARKTLISNPADTDAQQIVGEYLCLTRRNWNAGLPALQKSGNSELKSLVDRDLAQPASADEQGKLAKDWMAFAGAGSQHEHAGYADRAVHWLTLAAANAQGLEQRQWQVALREAVALRDWDQPYIQLLEKLAKPIESKRLIKTLVIGTNLSNDVPFDEMPDEPGLLVGLDLRIRPSTAMNNGQQIRSEYVEIVKPVFLAATGIKPSEPDDEESTGTARLIQLRARRGYALSEIRMEVGNNCYRFAALFRKITSKGLDPERGYWSETYGTGNPGNRGARFVESNARAMPVVGITGSRTKTYDRGGLSRRINEIGFITAAP